MAEVVDNLLDLARRLPPANIEKNVASMVALCPECEDELLGSVDQPLQVRTDTTTGRDYLICDYNRDRDSYRCFTPKSVARVQLLNSPRVVQGRHGPTDITLLLTMQPFHPPK